MLSATSWDTTQARMAGLIAEVLGTRAGQPLRRCWWRRNDRRLRRAQGRAQIRLSDRRRRFRRLRARRAAGQPARRADPADRPPRRTSAATPMTSSTKPGSSTTNTARTSSTPTASRWSNICRSSPSGGRTSIACWRRCAGSWCRSRSTGRRSTCCSTLELETDEEAAEYLASRAEPVEDIQTSEDVVVNAVGRELYELFFQRLHAQAMGPRPDRARQAGDRAHPDPDQHRRPLFRRHVPGDAEATATPRCSSGCSAIR